MNPFPWDDGVMIKTQFYSHNPLTAINILKTAGYIAPDFATEICQNYSSYHGACDITDLKEMESGLYLESLSKASESSFQKIFRPYIAKPSLAKNLVDCDIDPFIVYNKSIL